MKIVIATANEHKKIEMYEIFNNNNLINKLNKKGYFFELYTLKDIEFDREIEENGVNFLENAKIKVIETYKFLKEKKLEKEFCILGDDSGLIIKGITEFYSNFRNTELFNEVIKKASFNEDNIKFWNQDLSKIKYLPGIYSKRFGFIDNAELRNQYVIRLLKLIEAIYSNNNKINEAYFNTYLYFKGNHECNNVEFSVYGRVDGEIVYKPEGSNGFGYDPIFFAYEVSKTLAQLTLSQKNKISHRSRALDKFIGKIYEILD